MKLNTFNDDIPESVAKPASEWEAMVQQHWDHVSKPLDSMGKFEKIFDRIGAIQETARIHIGKKRLLILCADNGVVEEGISQSGQEVTLKVARQMVQDATSVGRIARKAGVDTCPIDIGINADHTGISPEEFKVRQGTRNFARESAMTKEETISAIHIGMNLVRLSKAQGYDLIGTGEMGIDNTTTSSAVCASLLQKKAAEVTGRGAGLSDSGLEKKIQVIDTAIRRYDLYHQDALTVLSSVGGLDIAGIAGICIGGALYRVPVVLDGLISLTAALTAERLVPGVRNYLIASHKGKEPACRAIEKELELHPVIDAGMALGEGTGAVMMMQLLDTAAVVYYGATFEDSTVEQYTRFNQQNA